MKLMLKLKAQQNISKSNNRCPVHYRPTISVRRDLEIPSGIHSVVGMKQWNEISMDTPLVFMNVGQIPPFLKFWFEDA